MRLSGILVCARLRRLLATTMQAGSALIAEQQWKMFKVMLVRHSLFFPFGTFVSPKLRYRL